MGKYVALINADIRVVKQYVEGVDEAEVNIAAYHCQQAVEKICAYACQVNGKKTIRTHKIGAWVEYLDSVGLRVPDIIRRLYLDITEWESKSRYDINFMAVRKDILDVAVACENWLSDLLNKSDSLGIKNGGINLTQ